jgi:hypothetical protein
VRTALLVVALAFTAALAALTVNAVVQGAFDVLTVLSLLVIALLGIGIVGALREPPR